MPLALFLLVAGEPGGQAIVPRQDIQRMELGVVVSHLFTCSPLIPGEGSRVDGVVVDAARNLNKMQGLGMRYTTCGGGAMQSAW